MMKKMVVAALILGLIATVSLYPADTVELSPLPAQTTHVQADEIVSVHKTPHIAFVLERINPERIANAQKRIIRDMYINKLVRYTLRGASAALVVGAGYIVLKWWLNKASASTQTASASAVASVVNAPEILTNEKLIKRLGEAERRISIIEQLHNKPSPAFMSFDYWKKAATGIRDYGIYFILTPLAVSRTNAAIDGVFVDRNIEWFMIQKTSLASQLQALKYTTQTYTTDKEQEYHNYILIDVCSRMVKQIELVLAFMYYTRDILPQTHVELKNIDLMIRYLHNCTDDMCTSIEQFLNKKDEPTDKLQLEAIVTRFETEVHNTINRFKDAVQDILNQDDA